MPLVEIPSFWLLFAPCGCCDGSAVGARDDGFIRCATADDALKMWAPTKRERDRMQRDGWTVRALQSTDDHLALLRTKCPHGEG